MSTNRILLVIDCQKIYSLDESETKVEGVEMPLANINEIIKSFNEKGLPIVYIRHIHKADGSDAGKMFSFTGEDEGVGFVENTIDVEYMDNLLIVDNPTEIIKNRYSAFVGTTLSDIVKEKNVDTVVVVGFMTNFCCESTTRDAHDRDLYVDFIIDATGTPDLENLTQEEIKNATAETLASGYANIYSTQEYLENM
jgi:ureidoacrylate peracid hydrolase